MAKITRAQRIALKRVFDRTPLIARHIVPTGVNRAAFVNRPANELNPVHAADYVAVTYRQFRRTVSGPHYRSDPVIAVPWCGMWLGIEADGYTHS